ncbi:chromosome segregation protein SMC [Lactobacillus terrae]|uniref:chromosome segregation protein SMC n=1 Tax=Lactobacillus terrae TaxID=2269374 RepID=UPI000C1B7B14|nr:chromosome segregation protein SMC [Lactobacillus terrae]
MALKSLTINGFKSFADKTKVEFNGGITGIVGPNGSGKSNVTEAIRWAMGEQSAKNLRGDKMADVIFSGSATKPAMNRAEVSLEFDNSDQQLKTDLENIVIKRKLFRNGDSEFTINNKNVRLKDITELFLDSGMGKGSFSIISQGRVEEIFNSKPVERRYIIEESAGVALFKQKKQQAENKLAETNDNLSRVSDIVSELSKQVEPLKEQASIARDYQEQKTKYDAIYKQLVTLQIKDLSDKKNVLDSEIGEVKSALEKIEQETRKSNIELNKNRDLANNLSQQIDSAQSNLVEKTQLLENLKGKIAISSERNEFNSSTKDELQNQIESSNGEKKQLEERLVNSNKQLEEYSQKIETLESELTEIQNDQTKTPEEMQEVINNLRNDYVNALQEQVTNSNEQKFTQKELERLQRSLTEQDNHLSELNDDLSSKSEKIADLKQKITELKEDNLDLIQEDAGLNQKLEKLTSNQESIQNSYIKSMSELRESQARKRLLENLEQEHAGFYEGAKNVLNNKEKIGGVVGAVAELMVVPSEYRLAIETVVSNQLQSIVTNDEKSAKKAIDYLRRQSAGRATLLPIDVIKGRKINNSDISNVKSVNGFIGVASDLVNYDDNVKNIIENILGNILVAKNIDSATEVSKKLNRRYRVVTIDGNVVNAGGSMTGGQQRKNNSSLLSRQQELLSLENQISKQEAVIDNFKQDIDQNKSEIEVSNSRKQELEERLSHFNSEKEQLDKELDTLDNDYRHLNEQKQITDYNKSKIQNELSSVEKDQTEQINLSVKLQDDINKIQSDIEDKQKIMKDFDSKLSVINVKVQEIQTQLAIEKNNFRNEESQNHRIKNDLQRVNVNIAKLDERIAQLSSEKNELDVNSSEISEKIDNLTEEVNRINKNLSDLQEQRKITEVKSKELDDVAQRNFDLQRNASNQQEDLAIRNTKLSNELDSKLAILREDYQISFEASYAELPEDLDEERLKKNAKLLKTGIDELGTVNLSSIEEYDKVKDRYEFLTNQQNDLVSARKQLLDNMSEIDDVVTTRFKQTFDEIEATFEVIFPEMFAGGKARLELTDPENLLETGIEIVAQPPGKKFQRLSLLSGGEKALTAIALLFSIIKVNPVPFCILDEVEASLDDANVYRFANYLNRYDDNTEFIVITHRKGTMMNVNRLYGVTMEGSGVSKILSVKVQE